MARMEFAVRNGYEIAGQGGTPDGLLELGLNCSSGREGDVDLIEAHKWFNLAAMRGNDEAKQHRSEVAELMSKADVAVALRRAREWLSTH